MKLLVGRWYRDTPMVLASLFLALCIAGENRDSVYPLERRFQLTLQPSSFSTQMPTSVTVRGGASGEGMQPNQATTQLRLEGKEAHDKGDFQNAADIFKKAADSLQNDTNSTLSEEFAICRLHQALCNLKSKNYPGCLDACSLILDGEVTTSPAIRARAFHRRAKAKLALGDKPGALRDSRAAALLGDHKAAIFYAERMRESSHKSIPTQPSWIKGSKDAVGPAWNPFDALQKHGSNPILDSFFPTSRSEKGISQTLIESVLNRLEAESNQESISRFLRNVDGSQLRRYASLAGINVPTETLQVVEKFCHGVTPTSIRRTIRTTKSTVYCVQILRRAGKVVRRYRSLLVALVLMQWSKSSITRPFPLPKT